MFAETKSFRQIVKGALGLIYPPQCACCSDIVSSDLSLCPKCWGETDFISGVCCIGCGVCLPDDGALSRQTGDCPRCDDCSEQPRAWDQAGAAVVYGGAPRRMIMALKHGDRPDMAAILGDWLTVPARRLATPDTVVIPIPMHGWRLLRRKYNQAELLAERVAHNLALKQCPGALDRVRATPSQAHLTTQERRENVADSIKVRCRAVADIQGRDVLIVDDVMASGATLEVASRALRRAGARQISVVVVARAAKHD